MVEAIISDSRGFLLINSIDKNNDSPAHLAAFRGHFDIMTILAKNHAFLDQPNAESKDPIATIVSDEDRDMMLKNLSKMELSVKNTKHLKNSLKKQQKNNRDRGSLSGKKSVKSLLSVGKVTKLSKAEEAE
jgi:ankyrin repeat protein